MDNDLLPATVLENGTPQAIALRKENVIESELKSIELNYRGLKIAGIDDAQGMKIVADARKYCKKLRNTAERICKSGREYSINEQKRWIAAEKYVVDRIKPIETELALEEARIEKLRDDIKLAAELKKAEEENRLQGICNEFAKAGKLMAKDEIRNMEPGMVQMMLEGARQAKATKEAARQKLEDEKRAADAENEALRKQIVDLQAQLQAKLAPPPASPAAPPLPPVLPESRPAMRNTAATLPMPPAQGGTARATLGTTLPMPGKPQSNGHAAAMQPAAMPPLPILTPLDTPSSKLQGGKEAELITADKAALMTFAMQVDTLKKHVPAFASAKATGMTDLFKDQIEKFVMFITKKREEL
jgi:hypothetical protein